MGLQGQSTLTDAEKHIEIEKHLSYLMAFLERMTDEERKFVKHQSERLRYFGDRTQFSNNQLFWLRDLVLKY